MDKYFKAMVENNIKAKVGEKCSPIFIEAFHGDFHLFQAFNISKTSCREENL